MPKVVIFDMDGLLIDSEPLWQRAEMEVFGRHGIPLTTEMCKQTIGFRLDDIVALWARQFSFTGDQHALAESVMHRVIELIDDEGAAKPGVVPAIDFFSRKNCKLAVCSGSYYPIIFTVLDKLGIRHRFDAIHSTQDEEYGKPHPAVYLGTAEELGVSAVDCVAIEDSFNGLVSAKAARMTAVCVPDSSMPRDPRLLIADVTLGSLEEVGEEVWERIW